jgi:hypothetical protein
MKSRRFLKYARKGAVLPLVVLIVLLMIVIGLSVTGLGMNSRLFSIRSELKITARCASDSAVSDAVYEMNKKLKVKPWDNSTLPAKANVLMPSAASSFDFVVTEDNNVYSVEGTGRAGNSVHTINTDLRLYSPFDYAMLVKGNIDLKNGGKLDWINYNADDWPARMGTMSTTNSSIILMNGSTINGDVMVGMGGNPDSVITTKTAVTITGGTYPITNDPELPPVVVADFLFNATSKGTIVTDMKNPLVTISTSGRYNSVNLKQGKVVINAPVTLYITGTVNMGAGTSFEVSGPTASLSMYITNDFIAGNSQGFNNLTQDARRLMLFCLPSCTQILLKNATNFYGAIYAPYANITLDNSANVYGSVVGNNFTLKNGGTFYYDANLRDRTVNDNLVRFVIHKWSED